ncbi:hypothetical protein [Mucilaginibacter endophyticus]|uniref:hypothetical protein n=1 Tax=Mucilaginibacter endophyticus TaxID=2675003 RepID=UPI000E0CF568|nr:hypothetical protein [Mucilaginibacter endophyticus]
MNKIKSFLKVLDITTENTFFTIAFFTGITLTYLEICIYRLTFISFAIPFLLWMFSGVIITPLFFKRLPRYLKSNLLVFQFLFNIFTWGGIVIYLFMAPNFYWGTPNRTSISLKITDKGTLAKGSSGCGEPYVTVKYEKFDKQIIFPCGTSTDGFNTVDLTLRRGLFGFETIESKTLSK